MAHEWDRGVLSQSSWHGLETTANMYSAEDMIAHGEASGALPVALDKCALVDPKTGLGSACHGVVAYYRTHAARIVGENGSGYRVVTPAEKSDLIRAAVAAGGKPTGVFSLRNGRSTVCTFSVGEAGAIRDNLIIADSYDGSMALTCLATSVRVVCANTLASAQGKDGADAARIRHSASLTEKIATLGAAIAGAVKHGQTVRAAYERAENTPLARQDAGALFDALWPEAPKDATPAAKTRAVNTRWAARGALELPMNRTKYGGTVADMWNAATWLVDRDERGVARPTRGGDRLDSLLFGSRSKRIAEINTIIEVCMRDGTTQSMSAPQALAAGVAREQVGAALLQDMLA